MDLGARRVRKYHLSSVIRRLVLMIVVVAGATTKRLVRALKSPKARRVRVAVRVVQPKLTASKFGPVIVIRRGVNELRYYLGKQLVHTFGVATGQSVYPTPTGQFEIVD